MSARRRPARGIDAALHRRIALLERIDALGSITAAARALGMSYKGAWEAVEAIDASSDAPLVERAAGGAGGGGTRLTSAGRALVEAFRVVDTERRGFLRGLGGRPGALAPLLGWLRRLSMRTSARNQFFGKVAAVRRGGVASDVVLALSGGDRLVARVTNGSVDELRLARGVEAFALVKAPWVKLSARAAPRTTNSYAAVVETVRSGTGGVEVVLRLPGGAPLVALLSPAAARAASPRPGREVRASFDAASVILGVDA